MNILHVEDEKDWFERIIRPALTDAGAKNIFHAVDSDTALEIIKSEDIDYVILDLAIPLNSSAPTPDISNGLSLADFIRRSYSGTPLLILTGQSTEEAVEQFVEDLEVTIFWDGKPRQLVKVRKKRKLDSVMELLKVAIKELNSIESIELDLRNCVLTQLEKRTIQLFCKHNEAIAARVESIDEGLSSSKVLRITLINSQGVDFHFALAKIDNTESIDLEDYNFSIYINKLPVGSFPTILDKYYAGCRDRKGIFYQFATQYKQDYWDILFENEDHALTLLQRIKGIFVPWQQNFSVVQKTVRELRASICPKHRFDIVQKTESDIDFESFEDKDFSLNFCIQHADLHGKNILVSDDLNPIIIDYGDVKETSSVLDIVTLELSMYFHPFTKDRFKLDNAFFENWFDDEYHVENSPFPKVSAFLRKWKTECYFMNRQYCATVYSYAIRQLTYDDSNKDWARALVISSIKNF